MSDTIAIHTRGLAKSYGDIVAVDHVDLEVATGRVAGLPGPNGAGKTTLMCMLCGLVRPDSGTMRIFGRSVQEDGIAARAGVGGFIETPTFYPYLSGRRNLELLARLDLDPAARRRVPEVLETAGLTDRAKDKVGTYSFGMRQRLPPAPPPPPAPSPPRCCATPGCSSSTSHRPAWTPRGSARCVR